MAVTEAPAGARADERMRRAGLLRRLLSRPELGAVAGAIIVWIFFAVVAGDKGFLSTDGTASYLEVASELGILAVAVSVALSLVIGFLNGLVVTRTRLPSFIVTLASLFIFRGVTIGVTRQLTGRTQLGGLDTSKIGFVEPLFSGHIGSFSVSIIWWLAIAALATWVLLRTRVGNWIFGAGGAPDASRNLGVPVNRLKIGLFMTTAFAACLVAIIDVVKFTSADVLRGTQQEFIAIIAVVMQQGIVITGVNADWFQVFLGGMLILAVLVNNYIRRKAAEAKR